MYKIDLCDGDQQNFTVLQNILKRYRSILGNLESLASFHKKCENVSFEISKMLGSNMSMFASVKTIIYRRSYHRILLGKFH